MIAPTPLKLAFYQGPGRWDDRLIKAVTRSPFSHCELVQDGLFLSASLRDGGVRLKRIDPDPDHWVFLPLEGWHRSDAWARAMAEMGRPYDLLGIVLTFTVPLRRHLRRSWHCSELCAHALGFAEAHMMAPGDVFDRVNEMNRAYLSGLFDARQRSRSND